MLEGASCTVGLLACLHVCMSACLHVDIVSDRGMKAACHPPLACGSKDVLISRQLFCNKCPEANGGYAIIPSAVPMVWPALSLPDDFGR